MDRKPKSVVISVVDFEMRREKRNIRHSAGLSLVELLVSMAITAVLLVMLASLLSVSLNKWNDQTGRVASDSEARAALETIVADIRSVMIKAHGAEWWNVKMESVEDIGSQPVLKCLSRPMDGGGAESGDVCAIQYRVEKRSLFGSGDPVHGLYRCVLSPSKTFESAGASDLDTEVWLSHRDESVQTDWLLAANVVDLQFRFQFLDPEGNRQWVDSVSSLRIGEGVQLFPVHSDVPEGAELTHVEIVLMVVDRVGQQLLNSGDMAYDEVCTRYGRSYQSTVAIPSTSF